MTRAKVVKMNKVEGAVIVVQCANLNMVDHQAVEVESNGMVKEMVKGMVEGPHNQEAPGMEIIATIITMLMFENLF